MREPVKDLWVRVQDAQSASLILIAVRGLWHSHLLLSRSSPVLKMVGSGLLSNSGRGFVRQ